MRRTHQCALGDLGLILMPHLKVEVVAGRHKVQRQQLVETDQGKTCIELKLFTNEGWVIPEADLASRVRSFRCPSRDEPCIPRPPPRWRSTQDRRRGWSLCTGPRPGWSRECDLFSPHNRIWRLSSKLFTKDLVIYGFSDLHFYVSEKETNLRHLEISFRLRRNTQFDKGAAVAVSHCAQRNRFCESISVCTQFLGWLIIKRKGDSTEK